MSVYDDHIKNEQITIAYMSDLHFEHDPVLYVDYPEADVLVLAGDIFNLSYNKKGELKKWFKLWSEKYKLVIYVFGNHEFYGNDYAEVKSSYQWIIGEFSNVYILDDEFLDYRGFRFIGSTLWGKISPHNEMYMNDRFTDYEFIRYRTNRLRVGDTNSFNQNALWLMERHLKQTAIPTIIISHHAPTIMSSEERFRSMVSSEAFCNNLERLFFEYGDRIHLWIHGHTHNKIKYLVNDIPVVCNPRGYPREWCGKKFKISVETVSRF